MSGKSTAEVKPVSEDQAGNVTRMLMDVARGYPGGTAKLQLAIGHSDFASEVRNLFDRLATEQGQKLAIAERPVWRTINLGTHASSAELRQALTDGDYRVSNWADDILGKTPIAPEPLTLDLVLVTVSDLGFPEGAKRSDIYEKALTLGLHLCPAEVGPQLRLQYPDQPMDEWMVIAMEPIVVSDGDPGVFRVARDSDGRWLYSNVGDPGRVWGSDRRWVFCRK